MSTINVKVQPGASRNRIDEFRDGTLKVRVTAPPDGGRANIALVELLAKVLGLPKTKVRIVRGSSSRNKVVEFQGLDEEELQTRLKGLNRRAGE